MQRCEQTISQAIIFLFQFLCHKKVSLTGARLDRSCQQDSVFTRYSWKHKLSKSSPIPFVYCGVFLNAGWFSFTGSAGNQEEGVLVSKMGQVIDCVHDSDG